MPFLSFRFHGFRNLLDAEIPVDRRQVFFIGPNGQGKTNFLEAVYIVCYGKSFRTSTDQILPLFGTSEMSIQGTYSDPINNNVFSILVKIIQKKKYIYLDGKLIEDRKDLINRFPCVVFCHDDLEFVKGSPDRQRLFFDQSASLFSSKYLHDLQSYMKVLRSRNILIKQESWDVIPAYDIQLAHYGLELVKQRKIMVEQFNEIFRPLHKIISNKNEDLGIIYKSSWDGLNESEVVKKLIDRRIADKNLKTTSSGPHRDRYRFIMGETDFLLHASTGQMRLLSLLLRLAQAHLMRKLNGKAGILLLDDVLLELDPEKRKKFMDNLPEFDQIFYTFLPGEKMAELYGDEILKFYVNEGSFHEEG